VLVAMYVFMAAMNLQSTVKFPPHNFLIHVYRIIIIVCLICSICAWLR